MDFCRHYNSFSRGNETPLLEARSALCGRLAYLTRGRAAKLCRPRRPSAGLTPSSPASGRGWRGFGVPTGAQPPASTGGVKTAAGPAAAKSSNEQPVTKQPAVGRQLAVSVNPRGCPPWMALRLGFRYPFDSAAPGAASLREYPVVRIAGRAFNARPGVPHLRAGTGRDYFGPDRPDLLVVRLLV